MYAGEIGEKRGIQRIKEVVCFFNAKKTKIIVSNNTYHQNVYLLEAKFIAGDAVLEENMDHHNINLKNS